MSAPRGARTPSRRTILAGLRKERAVPSEITGRQAVFVVNTEPRPVAGEVSEGMLFDIGCADGVNVDARRLGRGRRWTRMIADLRAGPQIEADDRRSRTGP